MRKDIPTVIFFGPRKNKYMNPLFKVFGITGSFMSFDEKVKTLGWPGACKWLIDNLGINYKLTGKEIPNKGPVLVYSNHPTGIDPYLLTAAIGRNDSYFWGDFYQSKKGRNVSKYIVPIAPKPAWTIFRRPVTNWPGYIYMRLTTPALSKEKTGEINKNSIARTIDLLKKNNQVIIFPSGGEYEFLKPGKGLSVVLEKCKEQNIPVKLIKLQIKNFGELGLFFHFVFGIKIRAKILKL
jgi:hypothetical protein